MNFIKRFLEKLIERVIEKKELEKEYEEYKKKMITLIDLKNYYDLAKKITGKELEVLEMTRKNFERYKDLINFRDFIYLYKTDEDWVYKNAKIKVIEDEKI